MTNLGEQIKIIDKILFHELREIRNETFAALTRIAVKHGIFNAVKLAKSDLEKQFKNHSEPFLSKDTSIRELKLAIVNFEGFCDNLLDSL